MTTAARGASAAEATILEGLNDEQTGAVTHGDGPLLIVAGAGTGKTEVITKRIAWLIATKRARPEEILALTFTDKAAGQMEARVDVLVPYGFIGATISTFHAFCDRLVREHAVELGLTSRMRVETPAEILVFLRERLFELGLERYLPLGRPDEHLRALVALFDRARDEDIAPEAYAAFAARLAAEADADPARQDRAAAESEKARAYARYEALLLEHGRVDFGAQIRLALTLLRERPYVRRELQERYRVILVDEFQDTNHVQFELVKLLAGAAANLTVVGDDDQSIYRFRGAKVENLIGFLDTYPGASVVVLRQNYRSGQPILDAAHRLIQENNPARLEAARGFDKRLVAARPIRARIEHQIFATASEEADAVAAEIAAALEAGERRPAEIAILARAHASLDPFAQALRQRGVRFRRTGLRGLYERPEVHLCLNVLRTIADPGDSAATFWALGDPLFGVDAVELAALNAAAKRRNVGLLRQAEHAAAGSELSQRSRDGIRRFVALHARLARSAVRLATADVLYEFLGESGILASLVAEDDAQAVEKAQNLNRLFDVVKRVGPLLRVDRVESFIGHLDLLIEMGDDPAAASPDGDEDAVHLLTVHNAKGLEFPVVYLVQLVEGRFPPRRQSDPLPLPAELKHGHSDDAADHLREERRLFYVGMTRARERLVLTHAADYGGESLRKVSRFVLEALALPAPPRGATRGSALESIRRHAPAVEAPAAEIAPIPADQPLTLSYKQMEDFLTCPLRYRYAYVAKVPTGSNPVAMYGIAMHHALRVVLQHRMNGLPITAADAIAAFESAWSSEGFLSREHEERRLEEGREALRRFVAAEEAGRRLPVAVEREFKFRVGNDLVVGRWDRIDQRREGIVLVDYKTSPIESAEKADARTEKSLEEHQLGLYALAYQEMFGVVPARAELHYVGRGLTGSVAVEPLHLDEARERVVRAAAGIRSAQFPPKPSEQSCGFCRYSRYCQYSAARGPA